MSTNMTMMKAQMCFREIDPILNLKKKLYIKLRKTNNLPTVHITAEG
jgi:hypothetical protein